MPEYVLNRNFTLRSTLGHSVAFLKGKPTFVPTIVEREVIAIGAERVDGGKTDPLDPEKAPETVLGASERLEQVKVAIGLIVKQNDTKDFTGAGVPTVKAVEKLVGFDVDRQEVADAWAEMRAAG